MCRPFAAMFFAPNDPQIAQAALDSADATAAAKLHLAQDAGMCE
jgi:hypothetical protein